MLETVTGAVVGSVVAAAAALLLFNMRGRARVSIALDIDRLVVRMHGWDVVYACRRTLSVPVAAVEGVGVVPRDLVPAEGMRLPGASLPGVIRAGSYGTGERRDFWDVRRASEVLVIQLKTGAAGYRRLVLQVDDPDAELARLRPTLGGLASAWPQRR